MGHGSGLRGRGGSCASDPAHCPHPVNRVSRPRARHARRIFFVPPARPWNLLVPRAGIMAVSQAPWGTPIMASSDTHSVTRLIRAAQHDQASAVGPLLAVYFDRLVQLARKRLQDLPGMANYDEDLALRSFYSVYRRVRDPERPLQLTGRDDLWRAAGRPHHLPGHRPDPAPSVGRSSRRVQPRTTPGPRADPRGSRRDGGRVPAPARLA